jgi:hypothetical protein
MAGFGYDYDDFGAFVVGGGFVKPGRKARCEGRWKGKRAEITKGEGHLGDNVGREKLPLYAPVLPRVLNLSLIICETVARETEG